MKKLISVILATVIFSLTIQPAFAEDVCDCGKTPLVVVSGMNVYPLIRDKGTPDEKQIWAPIIDIQDVALKAAYGIASAVIAQDWNKLGDAVVPVANKLLEPAACNADGDSKYSISTTTFPKSMAYYPDVANGGYSESGLVHSACDRIGADHTYLFNYDWRIDPLVNAEALNSLIETALAETNHKKVDLAVCSLGANQALAYLEKYGGNDIESCVFLSSAFGGSLVASEVFTKQIIIDKNVLKNFIDENVNSSENVNFIVNSLLGILDCADVLDMILNLVNEGTQALLERAFNEVLIDTLCTIPGFWALIRENNYETAKTDLLDPAKHAKLIARIDDFHYNVRVKRQEIINNVMQQGVTVSFCSHYNHTSIPVYPSAAGQNDGLVEATCTSGGATCAPFGSTFPAGYVQKNPLGGKNYVSQDNVIDASTCMFPDQVWFFKDVGHVACPYGSDYNEFVFWLLDAKEQPTVWTDARYPQFSGSTDDGRTLYPLAETPPVKPDMFSRLIAVFNALTNINKSLAFI